MFLAMLATQELLASYIGVRLGLYEDLAAHGRATPPELATRTGLDPRYVREWLEQQAVAGLLTVADPGAGADERVYTLPEGHREVLTSSDHPMSMVSLTVRPLGGVAQALPELLDAYRTGAGVADSTFGHDWREGHGGANRSLFTHQLPGWIRTLLPDVHSKLTSGEGRVADVGCGAGWASLALAGAYPECRVDGFDTDGESVGEARLRAEDAGLADRVTFTAHEAGGDGAGRYQLVCLLDVLHEVTHPVEVLAQCRSLLADGGTVLVMDARVAEKFTAPGDEIERFQYATSVLHCLPAARVGEGAAGNGTVLRPEAVRDYATAAGFGRVDELPVRDRFHRLYRLTC
ncbi:class I SAM-dependent methyltransferase [Salinactinospora qingdaonensis]